MLESFIFIKSNCSHIAKTFFKCSLKCTETNVNMSLFNKKAFNRVLWLNSVRHMSYCKKINTFHKRASMLSGMINEKDKRKTWHFEILQNNAKARNVFEKISRPSRRQSVLNVLFIQNISDVLSTGDVAPEILGCGIEITGVKVSPCCKIVNVYWQIPLNSDSLDTEIALILNRNASKLRAELISRNVLGRVPVIFFVRDSTNAYISAFEKAMQEIDLGPETESSVIPDDSFVEKIYEFKESRVERVKKFPEIRVEPPKESAVKTSTSAPQKPRDMKTDIFGLNHQILMDKVVAMKAKPKFTPSNNVIVTSIGDPNDVDLFSKIPGTAFYEDVNREELLKKFHIERKKLRNKKTPYEAEDDEVHDDSFDEETDVEPIAMEDFIEEDTAERF